MPVGAAMSLPAWAWPERASPKTPVVVPLTGVLIWPELHPPAAETGAAGAGRAGAAGVVDKGLVVAARFVAGSVEVGTLVAGRVVLPVFGVATAVRCVVEVGAVVAGAEPSVVVAGAGAAEPPPPL